MTRVDRRTRRETVAFARPFALRGVDGVQPAGTYAVETEEALIEGLSFPAYRRVATVMFLPALPSGGGDARAGWRQIASVDPAHLRAALAEDARPARPPGGGREDARERLAPVVP